LNHFKAVLKQALWAEFGKISNKAKHFTAASELEHITQKSSSNA